MAALRSVLLCFTLTLIGIVASGCSSYSKEQEQEMQRIRDMVSARSREH